MNQDQALGNAPLSALTQRSSSIGAYLPSGSARHGRRLRCSQAEQPGALPELPSRVLFTFAGGMGHFLPLLLIARALASDGHAVAFAAQAKLLPAVEQAGFEAFDTGGSTVRDPAARSPLLRPDMEREHRAVRDGYAGRVARQRASALLERAALWKPDLLVCDELDFGCMIAAERLSIPYATMLVIASGRLVRHDLVAEPLNALRAEHGLPLDPGLAMLSRHLVLSPFPPSLRDPRCPLPVTAHAFRPDISDGGEPPAWLRALPDRPVAYVTLGTVFNVEAGDLLSRLIEGLRRLPVNVIVTVGPQMDPTELGSQAENVRIEQYVDHGSLLPRCSLVVCHAGSGTVLGALAHGLPMLLLSIGADQPFNGARCEALGVAQVLDPVDATPEQVEAAAAFLLASSDHWLRASRVRDEIAALPGQATAVALLNRLARRRAPHLAS